MANASNNNILTAISTYKAAPSANYASNKPAASNNILTAINTYTTQYNNTVGALNTNANKPKSLGDYLDEEKEKVQTVETEKPKISWLKKVNDSVQTKLNALNDRVTKKNASTVEMSESTKRADDMYKTEQKNLSNALLEQAYDVNDGMASAKNVADQRKKTAAVGKVANDAKSADKQNYYISLLNSDDYDMGVKAGSTNYKPNADITKMQSPGNKIMYADANQDLINSLANNTQLNNRVEDYLNLTYATPDERNLYSYILGKKGEKAADEFLDYIRPQLNARAGQEQAANIAADTGASRYAREAAQSFLSGVNSGWANLEQNFSDEARPLSADEYATMYTQQDVAARHAGNENFNLEKLTLDAINTTGAMTPMLTAGMFSGGAGAVVGGLTSRGGTYQQLLNEGYTKEQADAVATTTGIAEAVTQYFLGGLSAAGGKLTGITADKVVQKIASPVVKAAVTLGIDIGGEVTEEILQNKIDDIAKNVYLYADKDIKLLDQDDLYTAAVTALSTAILQAPFSMHQNANPSVIGKSININDMTQSLIDVGMQSPDAQIREMANNINSGVWAKTDEIVGELATALESQGLSLADLETSKATAARQTAEAQQAENALIRSQKQSGLNNTIENGHSLMSVAEEIGTVQKGKPVDLSNGYTYTARDSRSGNTNILIETPDGRTITQRVEGGASMSESRMANYIAEQIENDLQSIEAVRRTNEPSTQNNAETTSNATNATEGQIIPPNAENSVQSVTDGLNSTQVEIQATIPQNTANIPTQMVNDTAPTQNTFAETQMSEEAYNATGGLTEHEVRHDADVMAEAQARMADPNTRAVLLSAEAGTWNDADTATAKLIMQEEMQAAENATTSAEKETAYKRLAETRKAYEANGTETARAFRQRRNFTNTTEDIVTDAIGQLYGDDVELRKSASKIGKENIVTSVQNYAKAINGVQPGDVSSLIDINKAIGEQRGWYGRSAVNRSAIDSMLDKAAALPDGEEFLRNLALTQCKSIAADYINPGFINQAKAIRYMNALSNIGTSSRNIGANTVFGSAMEVIANDLAILPDRFIGAFTGQKTTAFDRGLFSKEALQGMNDATIKSALEVALDAEADKASYAYNEIKGSTFKMTGNWFERFLATIEKYQGYALKTTDQMAKGATTAETMRGLNRIGIDESQAADIATQEAKYRTLQTESLVAGVFTYIRDALDHIGIGNKKTGRYGVGTDLIMFAQVPANAVLTTVESNPAVSAALALKETVGMFNEHANGGKVSVERQRAAAKAMGRTLSGASILALSALGAAKGLISYTDDDDNDYAAVQSAEGKKGLQWNVSGTWRALSGNFDGAQEGDKYMSLEWLPQLSSLMILGCALYESYIEDNNLTAGEFAGDSYKSIINAFKEFPAVSTISSLIDSWKYADVDEDLSKGEQALQRAGTVLGTKAGNTVSGFLPVIGSNLYRNVVAGLDDTERNLYGGDGWRQQAKDYVKAGTFSGRKDIAPKLDNFGNEIKNDGGALQFFNKTILPGKLSKVSATKTQQFVDSLVSETGDKSFVPDKNPPYRLTFGDEKVELSSEERDAYQKARGQMAESLFNELSENRAFDLLSGTQKAEIANALKNYANQYAKAMYELNAGREIDVDLESLVNDGLDLNNLCDFTIAKTLFNNANSVKNGEAMDFALAYLESANDNVQNIAGDKFTGIKNLVTFRDAGVGADSYYKIDKLADGIALDENSTANASKVKFKAVMESDIPADEKSRIFGIDGYLSKNWNMAYTILSDEGWNLSQIYNFFDYADYTISQTTGEGNANGQLGPYEVYVALQQVSNDEDFKRRVFDRFAEATGEAGRYDSWSRAPKAKWQKYDYNYLNYVTNKYGTDSYTKHSGTTENALLKYAPIK